MANARLIHRKISVSVQVNNLSDSAKLLFTWMIPYTDVEGKLKGDPLFVKATVIPMLRWPIKKVKKYIEEIANQGLIYYWQANNEWIIEFVNFKRYQTVRKDHEKVSYLPSFHDKKNNLSTDQGQSEDSSKLAQSNISESNEIEVNTNEINKSEFNGNNDIADKKSFRRIRNVLDPQDYNVKSDGQLAAKEVWQEFEPDNHKAFYTTYLKAYMKGVSAHLIRQFASEIRQDKTISNRGAIFNNKVETYLCGESGMAREGAI